MLLSIVLTVVMMEGLPRQASITVPDEALGCAYSLLLDFLLDGSVLIS